MKKINKKYVVIALIVLILIILSIFGVKFYQYKNSTEYKLKSTGYTKDEIKIILDNNINLDIPLKEYNDGLTKFITNKYFMRNRLDRYLSYYKEHKDIDINRIVRIVNANSDKPYYTDIKETTDISNLVLVNKYNSLNENYIPTDLVDVSIMYAYSGHKLREDAYNAYLNMAKDARKLGLKLIISSSFRTYDKQESSYKSFVNKYGEKEALTLAAKAGCSEHQTGLAMDIVTSLKEDEDFTSTDEFSWLKENAYKYGFILRYKEGTEDITGYSYEPYHYRYVGIDIAKIIYEEDITFDEYYAYYIENGVK